MATHFAFSNTASQILEDLAASNIAAIDVNRNGDPASPIAHGTVMIFRLDGSLGQFSNEEFSG